MTHLCPLCTAAGSLFYEKALRRHYLCPECGGIFLDPDLRLGRADEYLRYRLHKNDVHDAGYRQFVAPITSAVISDFGVADRGLDFGAGPSSVISQVLQEHGYQIRQYDPFFCDQPELLDDQYDYLICCEVMEHFYDPAREFKLLKKLLAENGKLYCMTELYGGAVDFGEWYYKNDPTHVFIYQERTLDWLKRFLAFSGLKRAGRLIIFEG